MNNIQQLRKQTGLSQSKFAALFGIPLRTLQKWEIGQANPPSYVIDLMRFKLEHTGDILITK